MCKGIPKSPLLTLQERIYICGYAYNHNNFSHGKRASAEDRHIYLCPYPHTQDSPGSHSMTLCEKDLGVVLNSGM